MRAMSRAPVSNKMSYHKLNARDTRARETGIETSAVQIAPVAGATGRVRVPITGMADTREP